MKIEAHWIEADKDDGAPADGTKLARVTPAKPADVKLVLNADTASGDGRSEWAWVRFQDGTLALAVFPQGATYEEISEAGKAPFYP